ncbi:hypothetical protein HB774_02245 [Rhizobium leguminosarum bv. viciae]|nr:hypothetical protein HB774_02245 [Rhizobium leguminosarum bv. viciae]
MPFQEDRLLLNLTDTELEELVKKWIVRLKRIYPDFDQPNASADMGRDAVGFLSENRYAGEWHNYQSKQLRAPLGIGAFVLELGKIFHYHCKGHYTLPTKYVFVAPNSCSSTVTALTDSPPDIGPYLLAHWDNYCLNGISSTPSPLTDEIREAIGSYDFSNVKLWKAKKLVEQPEMRTVMAEIMDIDPGEAPKVEDEDVPGEAYDHEISYIGQLLKVFGEHRGAEFRSLEDVKDDIRYGSQMVTARRRYLEHRAFGLHFRDSLLEKHILQIDKDVSDGVIDRYHRMSAGSKYDRLMDVMTEASKVVVSGPLGKHNRVTPGVKQGACHHFANTGKMPWT